MLLPLCLFCLAFASICRGNEQANGKIEQMQLKCFENEKERYTLRVYVCARVHKLKSIVYFPKMHLERRRKIGYTTIPIHYYYRHTLQSRCVTYIAIARFQRSTMCR